MCEVIPSFKIKPGTQIGNFRILHQLGRGFECEVYVAVEIPTRIRRALKIFPNGDAKHAAKIAHTARFFQRLAPTGVVAAYHFMGTTFLEASGEEICFLAFDLMDGLTLKAHVRCLRGKAVHRERESLRLLVAVVEKIARVHLLGYGVGDFDHGGNIVIQRKTSEPVFVDLESGEPKNPNRDMENDVLELYLLIDLIFPSAVRRDLYDAINALVEDAFLACIRRDTFRRLGRKLSDLLHETNGTSAR